MEIVADFKTCKLIRDQILSGFESGDLFKKPKFRSIITPKLFTQLFEFEFRAQNFLEQIKCFHVGRVSG